MEQVFTISGPPVLESDVQMLGGPSAQEVLCAQRVKGLAYAGVGTRVGGAGVGLFGVYKFIKKNPAAGVVSLIGGAALWFFGGRLIQVAAMQFDACRKNP